MLICHNFSYNAPRVKNGVVVPIMGGITLLKLITHMHTPLGRIYFEATICHFFLMQTAKKNQSTCRQDSKKWCGCVNCWWDNLIKISYTHSYIYNTMGCLGLVYNKEKHTPCLFAACHLEGSKIEKWCVYLNCCLIFFWLHYPYSTYTCFTFREYFEPSNTLGFLGSSFLKFTASYPTLISFTIDTTEHYFSLKNPSIGKHGKPKILLVFLCGMLRLEMPTKAKKQASIGSN